MVSIAVPKAREAVLGSACLLMVYYVLSRVYWHFTVGASRRKIVEKHGCKPVNRRRSKDPFGISLILKDIRAYKAHGILDLTISLFREIGPTFETSMLGRTFAVTSEPENLKQILSLQFKNFSIGKDRIAVFGSLLGEGIFTAEGASWSHSREMLRPNFVRSQVGDLATFQQHVDDLIQAIPRDGSIVDLSELFFKMTLDSASEFLFGESTNMLAPEAASETGVNFAQVYDRALEGLMRQFAIWKRFSPFRDRQYEKDVELLHDFVEGFVEKALQQVKTPEIDEKGSRRYIFLHELVKETQDKVRIRSELLNILLAGRDTTASLLTNLFFELSKRPDIWAKLQDEVGHLSGAAPTYKQIKDMKYLRYVMNESLRFHPVVPENARQAVVDTWLPLGGGPDGKSPMFVAKGQRVAFSVYSMHRRKDIYGDDADEFKPERWEELRPGWEYLPFSGGPRICIGQQYALSEAGYTTVRLLQEFQAMESRDDRPWTEALRLTCANLHGAKVALTPRSAVGS